MRCEPIFVRLKFRAQVAESPYIGVNGLVRASGLQVHPA